MLGVMQRNWPLRIRFVKIFTLHKPTWPLCSVEIHATQRAVADTFCENFHGTYTDFAVSFCENSRHARVPKLGFQYAET